MKTSNKLFRLGLLALGLSLTPSFADAQLLDDAVARGQGVSATTAGLTNYNPILIRYVGTSPAGGTVTVDAATGDITLKTGPVGSSTADATTECPVSGALGGVIDVSDAACNTLGEVVDAINASANWRAVIQDGLRSDSSNNTLNTLAETSASKVKGLALAGDSAVSLQVTLALVPSRDDISYYLSNGTSFNLNVNPFSQDQPLLLFATQTLAGTGADNKLFHFVVSNNQRCSLSATAVICTASETVTSFSAPGGGTTVNGSLDYTRFPQFGPYGSRLLIRGTFATTLTAVTTFGGSGHVFPYKSGRR